MKNAINYFYNLIPDDIHQTTRRYYFDYGGYRYSLVLYDGGVNAVDDGTFASVAGDDGVNKVSVKKTRNVNSEFNMLYDIYNLHAALLNQGVRVHQIVLNKDGQIITMINGEPYVLLKILYDNNGAVSLNDVWSFSSLIIQHNVEVGIRGYKNGLISKLSDGNSGKHGVEFGGSRQIFDFKFLRRSNWSKLWANKNDYLEYQLSQIGQKYHLLRESFSYYVGMGETSIQLVSSLSFDNITKVVSHKRIGRGYTTFDLYNPLNFIIDGRMRDVAEFFKNKFFYGLSVRTCIDEAVNNSHFSDGHMRLKVGVDNFCEEVVSFLASSNFDTTEFLLFFARMLYPTYYFDLYEDIIIGEKPEDEIKKVIDKVDEYEIVLKCIYRYYRTFLQMPPIEWLE